MLHEFGTCGLPRLRQGCKVRLIDLIKRCSPFTRERTGASVVQMVGVPANRDDAVALGESVVVARVHVRFRSLELDGVSAWAALDQRAHLPGRVLRYLGVEASEPAHALFTDYEPFFADTGAAAAALRCALLQVKARATVHSTWLGRPERVGEKAERWLDGLHGHAWWSKETTWRSRQTTCGC